jgi:DNA-binding NtrC family response regulator
MLEHEKFAMIRLGVSLKEVEAEVICRTLASFGGNETRAACILGVSYWTAGGQPS